MGEGGFSLGGKGPINRADERAKAKPLLLTGIKILSGFLGFVMGKDLRDGCV
jgi:hypothetical protein